EVWDEEMAKLQSKTSRPETSRCTYKLNPGNAPQPNFDHRAQRIPYPPSNQTDNVIFLTFAATAFSILLRYDSGQWHQTPCPQAKEHS
ncbi:hypothetical protein, partial [Bifidobacterium longum]|uniref:hypothetical protein n=1 Tax=Bifidobacterium longum TaxID=216816 RepID=UPI001A952037